jgi:hypothetical protein
MVCPAITGVVLQTFVMVKSAEAPTDEVEVELLLAGSGSGVVLVTLAVLTILPVTLLLTVPRIKMSSVVPDVTVPRLNGLTHGFQEDPPSWENSGEEMLEGTLSVTETLVASLGPRFSIVSVYWMVSPATTGEVLQTFVMIRSAEVSTGVVEVELLLDGFGSGAALLTLAVLTILPVTLLLTVPRIRILTVDPAVTVPRLYGLIHGFHDDPPSMENSGEEMLEGTLSVTDTPVASLGPRFSTVRVY